MKSSVAMRIGELAEICDVHVDTIRFYERECLLPPPRRRPSGYREYDRQAVERLRFIRRAKDLGFSLDDIRELLSLSTDREHGVKGVKRRAEHRLDLVEQRLAQLEQMRRGLKKLIDHCPGRGGLVECPILRALSGPDDEHEARGSKA